MCNDHDDKQNAASGIDRRKFLEGSALATGAAALAGRVAAQPREAASAASGGGTATKVTIALFLRGGADHLNLLPPTGDPDYAQLRPGIGVGAPGSTGSAGAVVGLPLDATFSMHPAMAGMHAAFTAAGSSLGVVHAVGHLPYDRSHFTSQDLFESGALNGGLADGWINRHLQTTATAQDAPVRALALRASLPRSMIGAYPCYSVASTSDLVLQARQPDERAFLETIARFTPTNTMSPQRQLGYSSAVAAFDLLDRFAAIDPDNYVPGGGAVYPANSLGRGLREIAEVIKADLGVEFFAIDQGGWDHHSNLPARIATNAAALDQAITAFLADLGAAVDNVVLVTMSEFGREVRENGSNGTDHGVGGAMMLAGGPVRGGLVHGNWPGLSAGALQDGRFLRPDNDFRDVLLEILTDHMGGTNAATVFPAHTYTPVGVI